MMCENNNVPSFKMKKSGIP